MFNIFRQWYYDSQSYQNDVNKYNDENFFNDHYALLIQLIRYLQYNKDKQEQKHQVIIAVDEMVDSEKFITFVNTGNKEYFIVHLCGAMLNNVYGVATIISSIDNKGIKPKTGSDREVISIKLTPLSFKETSELFLQYYQDNKFNISNNEYESLKKAFYICYALPRTFGELINKASCKTKKLSDSYLNVTNWLSAIAKYVRIQYIDQTNNLSPMQIIRVCYMYIY